MTVFAFTPPTGYRVASCSENAGGKIGIYSLYNGSEGCDFMVYTLSDPAKNVNSYSS
jgi:hypothetical protein